VTVSILPVLHVPDEPVVLGERWLGAVQDGGTLESVLTADDGVAAWLWSRWRSLAAVGLTEQGLCEIVLGYRREVWLWLAGERTWTQCCSGLIGRVNRRIAQADPAGV
jgi:hypothetical protein